MVPQYCRATPAESFPFFTKPDSSKIERPLDLPYLRLSYYDKWNDFVVLPGNVAHEELHRPDLGILDAQRDRLDRLPLDLAQLPHHILEEIVLGS